MLNSKDFTTALEIISKHHSTESAAGMFGENSDNTFQYTMKYRGRKMTPEGLEVDKI